MEGATAPPRACLRYQVLLALLARRVLGLGARDGHLPWVPPFLQSFLEWVQVFWLQAKHGFRATPMRAPPAGWRPRRPRGHAVSMSRPRAPDRLTGDPASVRDPETSSPALSLCPVPGHRQAGPRSAPAATPVRGTEGRLAPARPSARGLPAQSPLLPPPPTLAGAAHTRAQSPPERPPRPQLASLRARLPGEARGDQRRLTLSFGLFPGSIFSFRSVGPTAGICEFLQMAVLHKRASRARPSARPTLREHNTPVGV